MLYLHLLRFTCWWWWQLYDSSF